MNVPTFQFKKSYLSTVTGLKMESQWSTFGDSSIISCLREKNIQLSKLVGMGFDGAATFSGKRCGVQMRLKTNAPQALFVNCHWHCHPLQLVCVQAANSISGIKHVYTTLTSLWIFFQYSPK